MALPIRPNNPNISIPNNPFYAPLNPYVSGPYYPITLDQDGVDMSTGTVPTLVNNVAAVVTAGAGISVVTSGTNNTISNTGVVSLVAGPNITLSGSSGVVTISAASGGGGSVTSVGTGVGLTGGPITTSGTISLNVSGVSPGSYNYASITVDAYGRITTASNGTAPVTAITGTAPVQVTGTAPTLNVAIAPASTSAPGVVQLNDTTTSTSTTQALTANQGKLLQDQINAISVASNITLAGTLDASTGNLTTVTAEGTTAGFAVGSPLPAAAAGNDNYFVIASVAAVSYTPPGGSATQVHVGDWFLSDAASWQFLDVGDSSGGTVTSVATTAALTGGPITTSGTLDLAVTGVTAGTVIAPASVTVDACGRITALGAATNPVTEADFQAKGDLIAGYGVNSYGVRSVGTDGQVLYACSAEASGLCWAAAPAGPSAATPTALGTVYGCTCSTSFFITSFGYCANPSGNGSFNTALGYQSLAAMANGGTNTGVGHQAGTSVNSGQCNTMVGGFAGKAVTSASGVTAVGRSALCSATGSLNTGLGNIVGNLLTSGTNNTLLGACAGNNLTTGSNNVAVGFDVALASATGSCQLAIGFASGQNWLTGDSTKAIKPGAGIIDCANSCGAAGQVLMSNGANAICWGTVTTPAATVTTFGTVLGQTNLTNFNVSLDPTCCALVLNTTGTCNAAIGRFALGKNTTGSRNAALGNAASICNTTGTSNVAVGSGALFCNCVGNNNIGIGNAAGTSITGSQNVAIGCGAAVPNGAGSCQLAIGFSNTENWITGDSTKAIKPGAGIIDCADSCGTNGQVLMSNGSNAVCWGTVSGGSGTVTSIVAGTGLTGGTITTSGTIALDTACVIQPSVLTAKGDIISASAAATPLALGVGTDGQVLSACSACSTGLYWATPQTSPFITYTSAPTSFTAGTPLMVAKWPGGGTMEGTVNLTTSYTGLQVFWDFYMSGDNTNLNTGWLQKDYWPTDTNSPVYFGTWYVDFPVYPDPDQGNWVLYFSPTQNSLNQETFTFFYRLLPGSSVINWQI